MKWILPAYALAGLRSATAAPDVQKTLGNVATSSGRESKHGRKLKGRFLQVTDIHPDPFYKTYSSTSAGSFCHRGSSLAAGYYGAESSDCDSPLALVNATFAWINEHLAHEVDFVIWTGDSARHDNDEEIPRTEEQVLGTNRMLVEKFREVFGNKERDHGRGGSAWRVPVIPTFGNNDILPHNIMVRGPNRWTRHYQDVWGDIVPEAQKHAFDRGGWYFVEVIPNKLAVFSLNTIYFFDSNSAVDGCAAKSEPGYEHLEWLRIQLQFLRDRGMKAIMSGHVPPARNDEKVGWDETCWQKYTIWMQQYRDVVVGSVYGHMNIEHFVLQDFRDIDYDRARGGKGSKSIRGTGTDGVVKTQVNDADYLQSLRRIWAKLPLAPTTLGWNGEQDPSGRTKMAEKEYYEKIGGKFAEHFAVAHIAASVVPNYFPALRVFEYNITGLEDVVVPPMGMMSEPNPELWYDRAAEYLENWDPASIYPPGGCLGSAEDSENVAPGRDTREAHEAWLDEMDGIDRTKIEAITDVEEPEFTEKPKFTEEPEVIEAADYERSRRPTTLSWIYRELMFYIRSYKTLDAIRTIAMRKDKNRLIIPNAPPKHSPPGPAYSPQALSWLGYTQYYANLTRINNDFSDHKTQTNSRHGKDTNSARFTSDEQTPLSQSTSLNPYYDPMSHFPTTPAPFTTCSTNNNTETPIFPLRWNPGKNADAPLPEHGAHKSHPTNFTFEVEYDTRQADDAYGISNGSTARAWLELATRMGEFKPRRLKHDSLEKGVASLDGEENDEDQDEGEDGDEDSDEGDDDDDNVKADKKKQKKKHPRSPDDSKKVRRRRKRMVERTWFAFAQRAVVGTLTREEIRERFGYE